MDKSAPYASDPIRLSLGSETGLKYRPINCLECGMTFFERAGGRLVRVGTKDLPETAHVGQDGLVSALCGGCSQTYKIIISYTAERSLGPPLYMQPESIYVVATSSKKLRDVYCMECGKAFYSVSDRISHVVDNMTPISLIDAAKLGPMEARCRFGPCKQRYHVRV